MKHLDLSEHDAAAMVRLVAERWADARLWLERDSDEIRARLHLKTAAYRRISERRNHEAVTMRRLYFALTGRECPPVHSGTWYRSPGLDPDGRPYRRQPNIDRRNLYRAALVEAMVAESPEAVCALSGCDSLGNGAIPLVPENQARALVRLSYQFQWLESAGESERCVDLGKRIATLAAARV